MQHWLLQAAVGMQAASADADKMAAAAASAALGVASSATSAIGDIVLGVEHLNLQKKQLELSQQALKQNKELSLASLALTAASPYIEAKASGQAVKHQLEARYNFMKEHGADELSLLSFAQGKTVFASGANRAATTRDTHISNISPMPGNHTQTPIFLDSTRRVKTTSKSTQAGNPLIGEQPARGTQTFNFSRRVGTQTNFVTSRSSSTQTVARTSTAIGTSDTGTQTRFAFINKIPRPTHSKPASTQTTTPRTRTQQKDAVREIAFVGVGLNNARKTFYRDALMSKKTPL